MVTVKSEYVKFAYDIAADELYTRGQELSKIAVATLAAAIMNSGKIVIREHVRVDEDGGIIVCIDAASVETDDTLHRSLQMLGDALDHLAGTPGTIYFSDAKTFTVCDIPWLHIGITVA